MKTILFVTLSVCAILAYASALPASEDLASQQPLSQAGVSGVATDEVLEGAEQRWGGGYGRGYGGYGRGYGGYGGGYGRGYGGGYGGRGYGGGYGGRGYGGGYGGRGYGGWGR